MSRIKSLFDLTGKVAIITGSSKGIGEAMARGLAEHGAKVVVSSRKQEAVDALAESFKADGLDAIGIACHVAKKEQCEQLVEKTIAHYGRIDIVINNAGTNPYFGPIEEMSPEAYQKTMDINLNSCMILSNLCLPHLRKNNGGSVIHISSIEGLHPTAGMAAYNLSKAALIMLAKNQSVEWGPDNIRVNVICPGLVQTKLSTALWVDEDNYEKFRKKIPLRRMAQPDEMAGLAVFLGSNASSYMTGAVLVNDGGALLAPVIT